MSFSVSPLWIITAVFASIIWFTFIRRKSSLQNLQGPTSSSWLFGNQREFWLANYGDHLFEWQSQFGAVFRMKGCFNRDYLMLSDPRAVQTVVSDIYNFSRCASQRELVRLIMGTGLVFSEGDVHKRQRAVLQPAFSNAIITELYPVFVTIAGKLADRLAEEVSSSSSGVLNVCEYIHKVTLDVIGVAGFNYDFNSLANDKNPLVQSYGALLGDNFTRTPGSIIFEEILDFIPTGITRWMSHLPTASMQKLRRHQSLVQDLAQDLVKQAKVVITQDNAQDKDLLTQIVRANADLDRESMSKGTLTLDEVYNQVSTFMLAGEETVASTLSWALYEFALQPSYQARVRQEIIEAGPTATTIACLEPNAMPFLSSFIKEILRFHAVLPIIDRSAGQDCILSLSKPIKTRTGELVEELHIKKGQKIIVAMAGYNRLASVWGDDAAIFNPDRWLGSSSNDQKGLIGAHENLLTFSTGPKKCIGYRFAINEIHAIIIEVVRKFHIELPKGVKIQRSYAGSVIPTVDGVHRLPLILRLVEE